MSFVIKNNKVLLKNGKVVTTRTETPFQLPNLQLYLSVSRMFKYSNNTSISAFLDFSGNNYHAIQNNLNFQPSYLTNQFGNQPSVNFDATDDFMTISGGALDMFKNINQFTAQIVFRRNTLNSVDRFIYFYQNSSMTLIKFQFFCGNTTMNVSYFPIDGGSPFTISCPSNDLNPHIFQATLNPVNNTMYAYLDGFPVGSVVITSGFSSNTSASNITFGTYLGTNTYSPCNINALTISQSYSDNTTIQAQYRGYLSRGYL